MITNIYQKKVYFNNEITQFFLKVYRSLPSYKTKAIAKIRHIFTPLKMIWYCYDKHCRLLKNTILNTAVNACAFSIYQALAIRYQFRIINLKGVFSSICNIEKWFEILCHSLNKNGEHNLNPSEILLLTL